MSNRKPILCIDFDGVIHSYTSKWIAANVIPDAPVPGAFDALKAYVEHFEVHIYSARSTTQEGRAAMKEWFKKHGWPTTNYGVLDYQVLMHLSFPLTKPKAFLTIDDRAWCFVGTFPTVKDLQGFKTWQQKESP